MSMLVLSLWSFGLRGPSGHLLPSPAVLPAPERVDHAHRGEGVVDPPATRVLAAQLTQERFRLEPVLVGGRLCLDDNSGAVERAPGVDRDAPLASARRLE